MEAIKGMTAILLAGAVVFAVVVFYNSKAEPAYEAKIIQANKADTAMIAKQTAIGKKTGAVAHQKNKTPSL